MNKINHILINLIILTGLLFTQSSVLDDYVNNIDPYTGYTLESTEVGLGYTSHILNLTSQKWLTDSEVDHPIWQHWIVVIVPWEVNYETAFLLINGGGNDINPPDPTDEEYLAFAYLAVESKSVMALLETVPNQPLMFSDEDFTRTEDEIIACNQLIKNIKNKIENNDKSVKGFNVGVNSGKVAGQSIMHCHIHLIPRREVDVENPQGGIRGVIPSKQHYIRKSK